MLFFEFTFVFIFLPLVVAAHHFLPEKLRNGWLFLASTFFYAVSSWFYVPILLGTIVLDYVVGARIAASSTEAGRKGWMIVSVATNLSLLGFFKYIGFLTESLQGLGLKEVPKIDAALPVGISFFVFQSMSYTIDLHRARVRRARSLVDFGAFVTLYPQLIAGPIVRYHDIAKSLVSRTAGTVDFAEGLRLFVIGLGKKLLIADTLAAIADPIFLVPAPGVLPAWAAVFLYGGQIYFDFSGYSDMARGLGRMLGFHFLVNFDSPYQAASFSEFWRRWHISLSTWLRDYLYIPLGGNRGSPRRTLVNLMTTMLLGGLWHGASWNFAIWGALHGGYLAIERLVTGGHAPAPSSLGACVLRTFLVFTGVHIAWVFFRIDGLDPALAWLAAMFGGQGELGSLSLEAGAALLAMFGITFFIKNSNQPVPLWTPLEATKLAALFVASILIGYSRHISPFLYFRF